VERTRDSGSIKRVIDPEFARGEKGRATYLEEPVEERWREERWQGNRARPAEARWEPACACGEGEGGRGSRRRLFRGAFRSFPSGGRTRKRKAATPTRVLALVAAVTWPCRVEFLDLLTSAYSCTFGPG
jgi:hypothetical protein